jgi:hypothetical protein
MTPVSDLKNRIIQGLLDEAAGLPSGTLRVESETYTRDPYGRIRVEINPANARASYFEVSVNDLNTVVFVGENGITDEIPMADALQRGNIAEFIRGLFHAVASGGYSETVWRHKGHVIRVEGSAVVDGKNVLFEQGSRRLARDCPCEVIRYAGYAS